MHDVRDFFSADYGLFSAAVIAVSCRWTCASRSMPRATSARMVNTPHAKPRADRLPPVLRCCPEVPCLGPSHGRRTVVKSATGFLPRHTGLPAQRTA